MLVLVPGPDFAVVTKNTLAAGRGRGGWTARGGYLQPRPGTAAARGLGILIMRAQPVFQAIKRADVALPGLPPERRRSPQPSAVVTPHPFPGAKARRKFGGLAVWGMVAE